MKNVVVLISGGGTNLQAILDGVADGTIAARISGVISSKADAYGLMRAEKAGIPTRVITRKAQEMEPGILLGALEAFAADYVVLAGYLSILPAGVVQAYENRMINVHPSLIPSFCGKGFYGIHVHERVLEYGVKLTGATVHFVNEETDGGPIILQEAVAVHPDDTPEMLQQRVLPLEHRLLVQAVAHLVRDEIQVDGRKVWIREA
ncbi:phosphoribosylglycinamide formyltransferase [Eubacteriales bacterium OttesenSCG-928-M02]|nr:phosphoribosylglycinamide formyltransferase [Eubacteriales bacterium OttesenSCG-928-M02]